MFWIYRRLKSCLVYDFSWSRLTQKSHTFPPFMSFSSGTVFVVRNFPCPWICGHEALFAAIVLPILYCSFFFLCSVLPRLFHNSQLFLLSVLWNATWGFSLPSPSSFCLSLVLLRMSSLLIAVSFSYSLVHLLLLGDCYLIFVMPRNSLMWVWTVETYFFFCQGYLLRMQDEIHLFFRELSAVSW